jgi:L-lactate dehydrogenase complex protein LldF
VSEAAAATGFPERVRIALKDESLHLALGRATAQLATRRGAAFASLEEPDLLRDHARRVKLALLRDLADQLVRFEERLRANGVTVHWAPTAQDANRIIVEIARSRGVKLAVKSKSRTPTGSSWRSPARAG